MALHRIVAVIPAFRPSAALLPLVEALSTSAFAAIVVIDDGSGPEYRDLFDALSVKPGVSVMRHAVNLGKGAALKTGFNHALCLHPDLLGVVTADADGQHRVEDVIAVAERLAAEPDALVLGVRDFHREVPLRSRVGNVLTRFAVRLLMGQSIADTQTGLRGIPNQLLHGLLRIQSRGYEFELDMLVTAKHHECRLIQQPIATIYENGNQTSHFNPLADSMRIYFVLLRFSALSLLTAALDNLTFYLVYLLVGRIAPAQIAGRAVAVLFNYTAARRAVFLSRERHKILLPRYLLLVICSGVVSYALMSLLRDRFALPVMWAKIAAESLLFLVNFVLQRDFVFTTKGRQATDWTRYYTSTPFTAKLTRRYTARVLVSTLRRFGGFGGAKPLSIVEIGGANSCFLDRIVRELRPEAYHVVDTNEYGLELLRERLNGSGVVHLHNQDVMQLSMASQADAVFSTGLIEHFDAAGTRQAILAHFDILKPGGCAVISFPTPTFLYRVARIVLETLGLWHFHDERPLLPAEVIQTIEQRGSVLYEKTLWPLIFTQHLVVARKAAARP